MGISRFLAKPGPSAIGDFGTTTEANACRVLDGGAPGRDYNTRPAACIRERSQGIDMLRATTRERDHEEA
ncbi:MAG: hypothetical protein ACE5E1_02575 [Phycisphaerae bacterium]